MTAKRILKWNLMAMLLLCRNFMLYEGIFLYTQQISTEDAFMALSKMEEILMCSWRNLISFE